ncbi:MAG: hypothetical protein A2X49_16110 [Lentisphaerae bacterium GWF2_52_8]|nr:MAG: hypothetical protein A2X49_16110 [Lentisphaerae bacterium GWF2_52_8]
MNDERLKRLSADSLAKLAAAINPPTAAALSNLSAQGFRTLEVGCGPGQYRLAIKGHYIGIDISLENRHTELGLPKLVDLAADAHALPFGDNSFDLVFYSNTFYHFADGPTAAREACRVLKKGGRILLFEYSRARHQELAESYKRNKQEAHVNIRSCTEWKNLLEDAGFSSFSVATNYLGWRSLLSLLPKILIDKIKRDIVMTAYK